MVKLKGVCVTQTIKSDEEGEKKVDLDPINLHVDFPLIIVFSATGRYQVSQIHATLLFLTMLTESLPNAMPHFHAFLIV